VCERVGKTESRTLSSGNNALHAANKVLDIYLN
jgi:hypothetical protein